MSVSAPRIVYLAPDIATGVDAPLWSEALATWSHPHVLCLGPAVSPPPANTEARRRIGLLAIEQAAWAFCERDPRFGVAATRTELDWALKAGHLSVWAPSHMVTAALNRPAPDASDPAGLAGWLAEEIGAEMLVVVGAAPPSAGAAHVTIAAEPRDFATL